MNSIKKHALPILTIFFTILLFLLTGSDSDFDQKSIDQENSIDRNALVTRHNPVLTEVNRLSPLSVGNGEFAFTVDITGLQTFTDFYSRDEDNVPAPGPEGFLQHKEIEGATPLATQSQWGWHSFPNPEGHTMADATTLYDSHGRDVPYASRQNTSAGDWLRENPHRLNLARIGFELKTSDGTVVTIDEVESVRQELDLWSGTLHSQFEVDGNPVSVETRVHPDHDMLAVSVDASSLSHEQIGVVIKFPYGRGLHAGDPSDWSKPENHSTITTNDADGYQEWRRILDEDEYFVKMTWNERGEVEDRGDHEYFLSFSDTGNPLSFTVAFSEEQFANGLPDAHTTSETTEAWWNEFWVGGGAIDLSESSDPRAHELERRIVLSQYLMAIQSSGSIPPQETGLTYNSWFGKFHLEMHWWHGVHFALWDRLDMLENSLDWYEEIMPVARAATELQGYDGIRWPKMVSPDGRDSPSGVGVFLVWQQPHPIYYAELVHRQKPGPETLERFRDVVFETADFMASYPNWVEEKGAYVLGPPLIPAQEIFPKEETYNPGFELAYWKFGLETAQQWHERLGLERDPDWDRVLENLSPLPVKDGFYVNTESHPNTFTDANDRRDHPTLLGSCGFLPCNGVDKERMRRTLQEVMETWNWDHTWGWDYPLVAMTAARVGEPDIAIDALMMDVQKNTYLPNGHNYQDTRLTLYLPGNGGLLTAVAMMAGGWDGAPDVDAPGFPQDGSWVVQHEGLITMP